MNKKLSIIGLILLVALFATAVFWLLKKDRPSVEAPTGVVSSEDTSLIQTKLIPSFEGVDREDVDEDGLTNEEEEKLGTDPENPDTDGDGLPDGDEIKFGIDPLRSDTDGDGFDDAVELKSDYNPRGEGKL